MLTGLGEPELARLFEILYMEIKHRIFKVEREHIMSRTLTVLICILVVIGAFFLIRNGKFDSSKDNPSVSTNGVAPVSINGSPQFHKWREFTSPTGKFKVLFPALPQHATETVRDRKTQEPGKYDTYVAADEHGQAFMMSTIEFKKKIDERDVEDALKGVIADMIDRNKDNKLKTMEMGNFRKLKALDFSLTNGDILIIGKVFAQGNTIYILSMVTKDNVYNQQELDFFVNSLSVNAEKNLKTQSKQ